ncbi:hypothetical protein [Burkholderia multivorans]|uniref:hypothetical protein n=1 Tax=Burkholderia multivorans TaxID=87883 RepID=UPI0015E3DDB1|nr:hypothetical protein [Burkholderia multivorans]
MLRFTGSVIVQCLFTLAAVGCAVDASLSAVIYERAKNVSSQKVLGPGHRCNTMLLLGFFAPEHIADDASDAISTRRRACFVNALDSSIDSHNEFVY